MSSPFLKQYLMTAGPTPLPPAVSQVMAEPMVYHRAPAFVEVYARVLGRVREVFQTENEVLCFASSGSGGMESAVPPCASRRNRPSPRPRCGKFGERGRSCAMPTALRTEHWDTEWGARVDPAELDRRLSESEGVEVVFTHAVGDLGPAVVKDIRS